MNYRTGRELSESYEVSLCSLSRLARRSPVRLRNSELGWGGQPALPTGIGCDSIAAASICRSRPMWTVENRARYDRSKLRYSSDLTDEA
jgi:hypothetical protein